MVLGGVRVAGVFFLELIMRQVVTKNEVASLRGANKNTTLVISSILLPSLKQFAPENGCLEYDRFLLGVAYFQDFCC